MTDETQKETPADVPSLIETPAAIEKGAPGDNAPLTADEFKDTARQVGATIRDGLLIPVYRLGRRWLRGAEGAANEFFGGATGDKKDGGR